MEVQKISETIQKFNGVSYYRCGDYFQRKGVRLHRLVWETHNGAIPKGYEVHHINGDRADNNIENLRLMLAEEHHKHHANQPERIAKSKKAIQKAAERAKKWHKSEEGKAFHSQHSKNTWEKRESETHVCANCGKEFQSIGMYGKNVNTFCSNACKSAWRRKSGADDEERTCPVCGKTFTVNKYAKTTCCSAECARRKRWSR